MADKDNKIEFDPRNARHHSNRNKAVIRQSLQEVGPFRSIAIDGDGIIRAGNGVYEQAQEMGLTIRVVEAGPDELIAVKRPDLTGERAERAGLLDNYAGDTSVWDADVLALLESEAPDVIEGVFEPGELESILADAERIKDAEGEMKSGKTRDSAAFMDRSRIRIRAVVTVPELAPFEAAIRATGIENRGQALMAVCNYYLEHENGENPRSMRDIGSNIDKYIQIKSIRSMISS